MMLIMHLTIFTPGNKGKIGSLAGLRLHTGWQVDGVKSRADRWATETMIAGGWEMIATEIAAVINQMLVDKSYSRARLDV